MNRFLLGFIFCVGAIGCSVTTHTLYDHQVDFGNYKTFCWMNRCEFTFTGPSYLDDSLMQERVSDAIKAKLEKAGFKYDPDSPDLLVDFHITLTNESSMIYHQREDQPFYYQPLSEPEVINYLKGTIIIDIADKSQGRMVWRSEAIGYMDIHPEITAQNLRRGVKEALRKFPPQKPGK